MVGNILNRLKDISIEVEHILSDSQNKTMECKEISKKLCARFNALRTDDADLRFYITTV